MNYSNAKNSYDIGFFENADTYGQGDTYAPNKNAFGTYQEEGEISFDDRFKSIVESYNSTRGIDVRKDINEMMKDKSFMQEYKESMMAPLVEAFHEASPNDPHISNIIETVEQLWDNKLKSYDESVGALTQYLPISTMEFPVLLKQFFASIMKDIIEIEAIKKPSVSKLVRETYWVDNQTGEEFEYPKCIWDGEWRKIYNATKGLPIKSDVVTLTGGRLFKYDIIANLTDGISGVDELSLAFKISKVKIGSEVVLLTSNGGNGITVEFSTNNTFINGKLQFTTPGGTVVDDEISGSVDFKAGTVNVSSASGQVEGVVFEGFLSNEKNLRSGSVTEKRKLMRFTVEDGPKWVMPFSIETIEDAGAMLDFNYYNRMVDEIVKGQETMELLDIMNFYNTEFEKYEGLTPDYNQLESSAKTHYVDIAHPVSFAGDPFKYVSSAVQYRLKNLLTQITNDIKLEGLSFNISGNPMATQTLSQFTEWKIESGEVRGGIKMNGSYGFSTDLGAKVRIIASNLYDAYTAAPVTGVTGATNKRELILHITGFPTDDEHKSFAHLKYTSHIFTSQSETAYQSQQAPNGAFNIVTATSRYKNIVIQGIQHRLVLLNSEKLYGPAPDTTVRSGAPWAPLAVPTPPVTP